MVTIEKTVVIRDAANIPYTNAYEAFSLLTVELDRFPGLVKSLNPAEWSKPTACTMWDVRDILAHQAGGYASGTGYGEMFRQYSRSIKPGRLPEDLINELQLIERSDRSPKELIMELQTVGSTAAVNWAYHFRLIKPVIFPHPIGGVEPLRHLMWVIHSRDTWMHRLDICRATGREFFQTPDHDGRIVALILHDIQKALRAKLANQAIIFDLSGPAGCAWKIGSGEPVATVSMDALDFCIFVSGRFNYAEAISRANLTGDTNLIDRVLKNLLILF
jgi:uncharacterized protein (TIGR03083 family)